MIRMLNAGLAVRVPLARVALMRRTRERRRASHDARDSIALVHDQVMQRPGWSHLAMSVSTLTTGSQAIACDWAPDLIGPPVVGWVLRASRAGGTRTRINVSASPSSFIEIVWVGAAGGVRPSTRSLLTSRLTP